MSDEEIKYLNVLSIENNVARQKTLKETCSNFITVSDFYLYEVKQKLTVRDRYLCLFYSNIEISFDLNNNRGKLVPGGFILIDSNDEFYPYLEEGGDKLLIYIEKSFFDDQLIRSMFKGCFAYPEIIRFILVSLTKRKEIENNRLMLLLHALSIVEVPKAKGETLFDIIRKNIINNASDSCFSLDKAATLSFCSKRSLHNCLASEGTSYLKLLNEHRLSVLYNFLCIDNNSLIKILCYKSGFNSSGYAAKLFKTAYGVTPTEFRKQIVK
jgi:AraC-like DNA-binding protein